jgi:hypothetical protein
MSEKITCFYCGKELKEDECKMSVVIDTAMVYKNTKFSSETNMQYFCPDCYYGHVMEILYFLFKEQKFLLVIKKFLPYILERLN